RICSANIQRAIRLTGDCYVVSPATDPQAGRPDCAPSAFHLRRRGAAALRPHWCGRIMGRPQDMDSLEPYRRKRNPGRTPGPLPDAREEPAGRDAPGAQDARGAPDVRGAEDTRGTQDARRMQDALGAQDAPGAPADGGQGPAERQAEVFVVQEHHARRLHWDFRLERDGVLVSWALPKGVPDDPAVNHFAPHTEDHPMEDAGFAGPLPAGESGAGTVTIWDRGTFAPLKWTDREVKVVLHGRRLTGGYTLFQTRGKDWMIHRERQPRPGILPPMLARLEPQLPP